MSVRYNIHISNEYCSLQIFAHEILLFAYQKILKTDIHNLILPHKKRKSMKICCFLHIYTCKYYKKERLITLSLIQLHSQSGFIH